MVKIDYNILIDEDDLEKVSKYKWYINRDGYAQSRKSRLENPERKQEQIKLHRFILNLKSNDGNIVDHINGNKLDNRKSNLRLCTNAQNQMNCKTPKSNKLGVKGVRFNKGKYEATIYKDGKSYYLGRFDTIEDASNKYNEAAKKLFKEFARLNEQMP